MFTMKIDFEKQNIRFYDKNSVTSISNLLLKQNLFKEWCFKRATNLCFMNYLRGVIFSFSMGLYKSAFSTYSFGKARFSSFCFLVFHVSISLVSKARN